MKKGSLTLCVVRFCWHNLPQSSARAEAYLRQTTIKQSNHSNPTQWLRTSNLRKPSWPELLTLHGGPLLLAYCDSMFAFKKQHLTVHACIRREQYVVLPLFVTESLNRYAYISSLFRCFLPKQLLALLEKTHVNSSHPPTLMSRDRDSC